MEEANPVSLYLKEIGEIPLLSCEEEIKLTEQMKKGDLEARNRLIEANLRLVVNVARRYGSSTLSILDLIQEGNLGLLHAAEKFDYSQGCRFSTYATFWIRQYVIRSLGEQSRCIRLPVYMLELIGKVEKEKKMLTQRLMREPALSELAQSLSMTQERVSTLLLLAAEPVSLEMQVGEEDGNVLDFVPDEAPSPIDDIFERMFREDIDRLLLQLPERECSIIRLRYGFADGTPKTLEQISKICHITKERVRQLEVRALWRLRRQRHAIEEGLPRCH